MIQGSDPAISFPLSCSWKLLEDISKMPILTLCRTWWQRDETLIAILQYLSQMLATKHHFRYFAREKISNQRLGKCRWIFLVRKLAESLIKLKKPNNLHLVILLDNGFTAVPIIPKSHLAQHLWHCPCSWYSRQDCKDGTEPLQTWCPRFQPSTFLNHFLDHCPAASFLCGFL